MRISILLIRKFKRYVIYRTELVNQDILEQVFYRYSSVEFRYFN